MINLKVRDWLNVRSMSFLFWVILSIIMIVTMPNLDTLVREKGQTEMPSYVQSEVASKLLTEMQDDATETYQMIAVFNSGSKEKLTNAQLDDIEQVIQTLEDEKSTLGIKEILAHTSNEAAEKQLVSEDGTTILTQISVDEKQGTVEEVSKVLREKAQLDSVETYFTGTDIVMDDFAKSSQEGIQKTEIIAIIFILIVLVLVFRSPVVPIVSLITVGVSYIISLGIITQLVDKFDFPFSNFTQVFVVVILFGVGTDYNILLYTRFKEELGKGGHILKAITETYRTAGRTVIYSGIAVFIGFLALYLAEFKLYQATSAVAIGVAVLLLVLITLNPFFMAVLGIKMFWPIKTFEGHSENKLWHFLSKNAFFRPIAALAIIAAICLPFIFSYSGELNYDDLVEVNDRYESKQAIKVIEDHFSSGFSSPTNLVIKADESLATQQGLQDIDQLVDVISKVDGVSEVYAVTRPAGERIEDLYIQQQTNTLNDGLGDSQDGIDQIHEGLSTAESKLGLANQSGFDSVQQLIDGTASMHQGVSQLNSALSEVTQGFKGGAAGAGELKVGLTTLQDSVSELSVGAKTLQTGYAQVASGFGAFSQTFTAMNQALTGAEQGYMQIEQSMTALITANPELASDVNVQTALETAQTGKQQMEQLAEQMSGIAPKYAQAVQSLNDANSSFAQITAGLQQVEAGATKLATGAGTLQSGLQSGATGSAQIESKTAELETGLSTVNDGQKQLQTGLSDLQDQMTTLQNGLVDSTEGLSQISDGLTEAQDYLGGLSDTTSGTFYIPQEVLEGDEFKDSMDAYMSSDRQITKLMIILEVNPYSKEAMEVIKEVDAQVQSSVSSSDLKDAQVALGGKSAQNVDLQSISSNDFTRTIVIMMIGIAIVLFIITRSLWQPVIIIASLILVYFTTLGLSEIISTYLLGQDVLSWNVPFFSFIMIVALGVDYSIFLMMRYHEQEGAGLEAIIDAAKQMGGVVLSAALILGGTFAALIPSGIVTLMQVAILVMVGLILLSFVMLPIFIPAVLGLSKILSNLFSKDKESK